MYLSFYTYLHENSEYSYNDIFIYLNLSRCSKVEVSPLISQINFTYLLVNINTLDLDWIDVFLQYKHILIWHVYYFLIKIGDKILKNLNMTH